MTELIRHPALPKIPNFLEGEQRKWAKDLLDFVKRQAEATYDQQYHDDIIAKAPWIDVRAFGYVGDGTTCEATAINSAIAFATGGKKVKFPSSSGVVTSEITANVAGLILEAEGKVTISVTGAIKGFNVSAANVTIRGFTITGDNTVSNYGVYSDASGTTVENCIISEFDNCIWFAGADATARNNQISQSTLISGAGSMYGVIIYDTTGALVEGNKITMPTYSSGTVYPVGVYIGNAEASIEENRVVGNHIYNGFDGINIRGPYSVVSGNQIKGSYEAGILADGESASSTTTSRTVISNNTVQTTTRWGIAVIKDNYGFNITGNNLFNCGTGALGDDAGIHLGSGNLNIVKRSAVSGNTVEGGKIGINIHNNTTYAQEHIAISGNSIYNCTVVGVAITRGDNVSVVANSINACTTYGIQIASSESSGLIIDDNVLSDNGTNLSVVAGVTNIRIGENVGVPNTTAVSTTYTALMTDKVILGDATAAAFNLTLPTVASCINKIFTIKKIDAGANVVNIQTAGAETIDGADPYTLAAQYKYATIISDGTNWHIMANN